MISYELSKKLKDAGFSQKIILGTQFYRESGVLTVWTDKRDVEYIHEDWAINPTLSELIKACGDDLKGIGHFPKKWFGECTAPDKLWCAYSYGRKESEGDTLEEAVALLYLELNKK